MCGVVEQNGWRRATIACVGSGPDGWADDEEMEVRPVQPYQARKPYLCPGCNGEIAGGVGHVVAVPVDAPDLRRHWHHPCWEHHRHRRETGRRRRRR